MKSLSTSKLSSLLGVDNFLMLLTLAKAVSKILTTKVLNNSEPPKSVGTYRYSIVNVSLSPSQQYTSVTCVDMRLPVHYSYPNHD
ncbi:hypothetical protein CUMW_085250 [Citrus unshiu]|nr:hypothetical protein CUMW_085250 [Citrus unshiu]